MGTLSLTTPQDSQTDADAAERYRLEERSKSGARWFYWIAALSFITSVVAFSGSGWGFFVSLGLMQLVDGIAAGVAAQTGDPSAQIVALVFDATAAGLLVLLGHLASKRHASAFLAGMIIYLLDALVFVWAEHWLGLAFHAYVLFSIFGGYKACTTLNALEGTTGLKAFDLPPLPTRDATPAAEGAV